MKRTTVMLPDDLKIRALKHAKAIGISLGALIRESLEKAISNDGSSLPHDPFFDDSTVFNDDIPADLSLHHDDYIYGGKS